MTLLVGRPLNHHSNFLADAITHTQLMAIRMLLGAADSLNALMMTSVIALIAN
jgi:hypothetical protein